MSRLMQPLVVALTLIASTSFAVPPRTAPLPPTLALDALELDLHDGSTLLTLAKARPRPSAFALVRFLEAREECSGLGGTHATFEVVAHIGAVGFTPEKLGLGGHGFHMKTEQVRKFPRSGWFVVAVGKPLRGEDRVARRRAGWCIGSLAPIDAKADYLVPVTDELEGRALLARLRALIETKAP